MTSEKLNVQCFEKNHFWTSKKTTWSLGRIFAELRGLSGAKVWRSCTSRRELSSEYSLANIGFDTAENEALEVWRRFNSFFNSLLSRQWSSRTKEEVIEDIQDFRDAVAAIPLTEVTAVAATAHSNIVPVVRTSTKETPLFSMMKLS